MRNSHSDFCGSVLCKIALLNYCLLDVLKHFNANDFSDEPDFIVMFANKNIFFVGGMHSNECPSSFKY